MTLAELPDRISDEEFKQWLAYDLYVQPIGDERLARQSALTTTVLANSNRDTKKRPEPYSIDDFDLYRRRVSLTKEQEEEAYFRAWESAGLIVKKKTD